MVNQNESPEEGYARLALQLLQDAEQDIWDGDTVQGGEKLWEAASQAIMAYCVIHGLPYLQESDRKQAVLDLAVDSDDRDIALDFSIAEFCHSNSYHQTLTQEDLEGYPPSIQSLVTSVLVACQKWEVESIPPGPGDEWEVESGDDGAASPRFFAALRVTGRVLWAVTRFLIAVLILVSDAILALAAMVEGPQIQRVSRRQ